MARQNSKLPQGAAPHLRSPYAQDDQTDPAQTYENQDSYATHDPYNRGYPQPHDPYRQPPYAPELPEPYDPAAPAGRAGPAGSAPPDIFSTLRPEGGAPAPAYDAPAFEPPPFNPPRFQAFTPPAHEHAQGLGPGQTDAHFHARPQGRPQPHGQDHPQDYDLGLSGLPHTGLPHAGLPHESHGHHVPPQPSFGAQQDHGPYEAQDPYGRPLDGAYPASAGHQPDPGLAYDPPYGHPPHGAPYDPAGPYGAEPAYDYADPYHQPGAGEGYAAAHPGMAGHTQGDDGAYYDEPYAEDDEAPAPRGPRAIMVAGALLGAIILGGGLAYGYKAMTGGADGGKLPILRADSAPAKAEPTEPGGRQMAHTDKKFLNRLDEDSEPRPVPVSILPPPERETDDGPRRVPTVVINRDGSISPTSGMRTGPPGPPSSGVPGLLVDGLGPRPPAPMREAAPPPERIMPPEPSPRLEVPRAPEPPQRVAAARSTIVEPPEPPPASRVRAQPEPKRAAPVRQAARTPPPAASAPSAGYVAVLSSRRSHMDALKSFADIQQRHGSVLQGRTPDVRPANLGEKGTWYRLVVGPPGSREAANAVCSQLRGQGYSGCWVMAY